MQPLFQPGDIVEAAHDVWDRTFRLTKGTQGTVQAADMQGNLIVVDFGVGFLWHVTPGDLVLIPSPGTVVTITDLGGGFLSTYTVEDGTVKHDNAARYTGAAAGCQECWGTGYHRGWGGPCTRGCKP